MVRREGRVFALALVLALLALCTACSRTVPGRAAASAEELARPPQSGSCWQLNAQDVGSPLDQPVRRSCTEPHNSETVFVSTVAAPRDLPYPTEAQLRQLNRVEIEVERICSDGDVRAYLGD